MEWSAPVIVLGTRPFGEGDVVATVFGTEQGLCRGLARGGGGRRGAAFWQPGNLLAARWVGRLAEQLGSLSAEMIHPTAALAMADAWQLAMLNAALAVTEGALPEHEAHLSVFSGLLDLMKHLADGPAALAEFVRWEIALLAAVGYGLDTFPLRGQWQSGAAALVSPRSGRAVSAESAAPWRERLLKLPQFLLGPAQSDAIDWCDGLKLSGHFLARNVFGLKHRPLPQARLLLYDRVAAMASAAEQACQTR